MRLAFLIRTAVFCIWCVVLTACASVKIETGQTKEEAVEDSQERARQMRADWARQIDAVETAGQFQLLIGHIENVTGQYFNFSNEVARQWRQAQQGRNQEVPVDEMRKMIALWTDGQRPMLRANDDNLEYARRLLLKSNRFSKADEERIEALITQYYNVYTAVFLPNHGLDGYESNLNTVRRGLDVALDDAKTALRGYQ